MRGLCTGWRQSVQPLPRSNLSVNERFGASTVQAACSVSIHSRCRLRYCRESRDCSTTLTPRSSAVKLLTDTASISNPGQIQICALTCARDPCGGFWEGGRAGQASLGHLVKSCGSPRRRRRGLLRGSPRRSGPAYVHGGGRTRAAQGRLSAYTVGSRRRCGWTCRHRAGQSRAS